MAFYILDDELTSVEGVQLLEEQLIKQKKRLLVSSVFFIAVVAIQIACLAYDFHLHAIDEAKNWPQVVAICLCLLSGPLIFISFFHIFFAKKTELEINFLSDTQRSGQIPRFSNRLFLALSIFVMVIAVLIHESENMAIVVQTTFLLLLLLAICCFFYTIVEKCLKYHFFYLSLRRGDEISNYHRNPLIISLVSLLFFWFLISMGATDAISPASIAPFVKGKIVTVGATFLSIGGYFTLEFIALLLQKFSHSSYKMR